MSIATNTAITAVNLSLAAQASADADRAQVERCKVELLQYEPKAATVQQMQSYAECVRNIYPQDSGPAEVMAYKIVIGVLLLGFIIGAVRGFLDNRYEAIPSAVFCGLAGASIAFLICILLGAAAYIFS